MSSYPDKRLVYLSFLWALLPLLLLPLYWPGLRLNCFAPYLVLIYYKRPLPACLWHSLAAGVVMDLLSAKWPLGLHVVTYCLTTLLLYRAKAFFFEDKPWTLPAMTLLFSICASLGLVTMLKIFTSTATLSWQWALTDLCILPIVDALYALLWFSLPASLLRRRPSRHSNTFSLKAEE